MKLFILLLFAAPVDGGTRPAQFLGLAPNEATCAAMSRALIVNEEPGAEIHCLPVGETEWA